MLRSNVVAFRPTAGFGPFSETTPGFPGPNTVLGAVNIIGPGLAQRLLAVAPAGEPGISMGYPPDRGEGRACPPLPMMQGTYRVSEPYRSAVVESLSSSQPSRRPPVKDTKRIEKAPSDGAGIHVNVTGFMDALDDLDLSELDSDSRGLACAELESAWPWEQSPTLLDEDIKQIEKALFDDAGINESSGLGPSVVFPQAAHLAQAAAPAAPQDQLKSAPLLPSVCGVDEVRLHAGAPTRASSPTQCKGAAACAIDGCAMPGTAKGELFDCMAVLDDSELEELKRETPGLLVVGLDSLSSSERSHRQRDEDTKRIEKAPSDDASIYINVSRFMNALDDLDLSELHSEHRDLACTEPESAPLWEPSQTPPDKDIKQSQKARFDDARISGSSGLGASVACPQAVYLAQAAAPQDQRMSASSLTNLKAAPIVAATQARGQPKVPEKCRKRPAGDPSSNVGSVDAARSEACRTLDMHTRAGPADREYRRAAAVPSRSPRLAQGPSDPAAHEMWSAFADTGSHAAAQTHPQQQRQKPSGVHGTVGTMRTRLVCVPGFLASSMRAYAPAYPHVRRPGIADSTAGNMDPAQNKGDQGVEVWAASREATYTSVFRGSPSGLFDDGSSAPIAARGPGAQNELGTAKSQVAKEQQSWPPDTRVTQRLQEVLQRWKSIGPCRQHENRDRLHMLTDIVRKALGVRRKFGEKRCAWEPCAQLYIESRVHGMWPEIAAILEQAYPAVDWARIDEKILSGSYLKLLKARLGPPLKIKDALWQQLQSVAAGKRGKRRARTDVNKVLNSLFLTVARMVPISVTQWTGCGNFSVKEHLMRWAADGRLAKLKALLQRSAPDLYQQPGWSIVENWLSRRNVPYEPAQVSSETER